MTEEQRTPMACPFCQVPAEATVDGVQDTWERCSRCQIVWEMFRDLRAVRTMAKLVVAYHIGQDGQHMEKIVEEAQRIARGVKGEGE